MKKNNIILFSSIIGFSAVVIYLAMGFRELPPILQRGLSPSSFPIGIAIMIIVFSLISLFKTDFDRYFNFNKKTLATLLLIVVFLFILSIDFMLALAFIGASIYLLWTEKISLAIVLLLTFLLPVGIFILFSEILTVRFPRGVIIDLIYR